MSGDVICEKGGTYCFIEAHSKLEKRIRGDKLIDRGANPNQDAPHGQRYEVKEGDQTVADICALSWWFQERPDHQSR